MILHDWNLQHVRAHGIEHSVMSCWLLYQCTTSTSSSHTSMVQCLEKHSWTGFLLFFVPLLLWTHKQLLCDLQDWNESQPPPASEQKQVGTGTRGQLNQNTNWHFVLQGKESEQKELFFAFQLLDDTNQIGSALRGFVSGSAFSASTSRSHPNGLITVYLLVLFPWEWLLLKWVKWDLPWGRLKRSQPDGDFHHGPSPMFLFAGTHKRFIHSLIMSLIFVCLSPCDLNAKPSTMKLFYSIWLY